MVHRSTIVGARLGRVLFAAIAALVAACSSDTTGVSTKTDSTTAKVPTDTTTKPAAPRRSTALPFGWLYSVSASYAIGTDSTNVHGGQAAAYIASRPSPTGFATITQFVRADAYRGKRIRWSAWVKPTNVTGAGGAAWARVD